MTDLTLEARRYVSFSGTRGGNSPCTLGQINTLEWIGDAARAGAYASAEWAVRVPEGVTVDDIADALAILLERHESLRTTYVTGLDPVQCVARSGALVLDVYAADTSDDLRYAETVLAMIRRAQAMPFDYTRQLPLRAAVAVSAAAARVVVIACTHMAVDCESMTLIIGQFRRLMSDPASALAGPPGHQPADQVTVERSARGRRQAQAALVSWERHLQTMPQFLYAVPPLALAEDPPRPQPGTVAGRTAETVAGRPVERAAVASRTVAGWLRSPAVRLALPHIAARTRTTPPSVIVSALCAVLARRTGHRELAFVMSVNNRTGRHLEEYVGSLAQDSPLAVDTQAPGFDALTRRVATAALRARLHGRHDARGRLEIQARVGRHRGTHYKRDCAINISQPDGGYPRPDGSPAPTSAALAQTSIRWEELADFDAQLLLRVMEFDGAMQIGLVSGDTAIIPAAELERLLRAMERLLVAAAAGDIDRRRMGEVAGIAPIERGPGWLRVDSCWVQQSEVQRLVAEALPGAAARVFAVPDDAGRPELVAYLVSRAGAATSEQAHHACLTLLPGRYTAMTPTRYVICDHAPANPADIAAWHRQRVRARGTGRPAAGPRARDMEGVTQR